MHKVPNRQVKCNKHIVFGLITHAIKSETLTSLDFTDCLWKGNLMFMWPFGSKSRKREGPQGYSHNIGRSAGGTIHLRRRQIFMIFDPYPPTIGIPAKYLWRGFLILIYCDIWTIGTWGYPRPSPLRLSSNGPSVFRGPKFFSTFLILLLGSTA